MSVREVTVEWLIAKDEEDWKLRRQEALAEPQPANAAVVTKPHLRRWLRFVAALMILSAGGVWLWHISEAGLHQLEREVGEAVQVEVGALATRGASSGYPDQESLFQTIAREEAPKINAELLAIQGDKAAARVLLQTEDGEMLRQVRFYHRSELGWKPMAPDESLWGTERHFESDYFIYQFRQQDALAVISIVEQMDAIYATLLNHFGLPQPQTKRVIEISLLRNPGRSDQPVAEDEPWVMASPARYLAPVELSDGELLAQAIALAMLDHTLAQAQIHYGVKWQWLVLYNGLYLWQLWELDLPLTQWQDNILAWHFRNEADAAKALPEQYDKLCAAHALWMVSPVAVHIPHMCTDTIKFMACCYPHDATSDLTRLEQTCKPSCAMDLAMHLENWRYCSSQVPMLSTVIEYAVDAYGEEKLPVLLASLNQYETWDDLLLAVYGVSPDQFKQGWQAYIATHYR